MPTAGVCVYLIDPGHLQEPTSNFLRRHVPVPFWHIFRDVPERQSTSAVGHVTENVPKRDREMSSQKV